MKDHIETPLFKLSNLDKGTQCTELFVTDKELNDHVKTDPPKLDYPCNFCEKEFEVFKELIVHIKRCHTIPSDSTLNRFELVHDSENNEMKNKIDGYTGMSDDLTDNDPVSPDKSKTLITAEQFKRIVDEVFGKYEWYKST